MKLTRKIENLVKIIFIFVSKLNFSTIGISQSPLVIILICDFLRLSNVHYNNDNIEQLGFKAVLITSEIKAAYLELLIYVTLIPRSILLNLIIVMSLSGYHEYHARRKDTINA